VLWMFGAAGAVDFFLEVVHAARQLEIGALHRLCVEPAIGAVDFASYRGEFILQILESRIQLVEAFAEDVNDVAKHGDDLIELFAGVVHTISLPRSREAQDCPAAFGVAECTRHGINARRAETGGLGSRERGDAGGGGRTDHGFWTTRACQATSLSDDRPAGVGGGEDRCDGLQGP